MRRVLSGRILLGVCLFYCFSNPAHAQAPVASSETSDTTLTPLMDRMRDDVLRMSEYFDTLLPGTLHRYNLIVDFVPKVSDFRSREFIRYPLDVSYGIRENWEIFGGLTPFSPNPINSGWNHRWGMGDIRGGLRHNLAVPKWAFFDKTTIGFEVLTPLGKPPSDLIDHYTHLRPFLSAARALPWPGATFYTNLSYDRAVRTPLRADIYPPDVVHRNIAQVSPGVLYKPGEFGGFVEFGYTLLDEDNGNRLAHDYNVGGIWDVPLRRTKRWHLPGKWQIELAYKIHNEEDISGSRGFSLRVRVRTTLREVLTGKPATPAKTDKP